LLSGQEREGHRDHSKWKKDEKILSGSCVAVGEVAIGSMAISLAPDIARYARIRAIDEGIENRREASLKHYRSVVHALAVDAIDMAELMFRTNRSALAAHSRF
jgi:hypothetical protein